MPWQLVYLTEFSAWLEDQEIDLQDEVIAHLGLLKEYGPLLGRPSADTLKGSKFPNLKELRLSFRGAPIRILFAFDPRQQGVIILAGDKSGDKRWYTTNIPVAEERYAKHLEKQKKDEEENAKMESEKIKKEKGR